MSEEGKLTEVPRQLKPIGRQSEPGDSATRLAEHREQIRAWLAPESPAERGLRLTKVHELLGRLGVRVPYSSLYRFAIKHCDFGARKRMTVRVADVEPGELAEVDFGRLGLVPDRETGRRRVLHALIVTLVYSRHQYVHLTTSQKIPDVIEGLEDAWEYFGGAISRSQR